MDGIRIDLFGTENGNYYIFEKGNSNVAVAKLEEIARERLLQYFPDYTVELVCLPNQADYTDIPVYKRGKMILNINTDNALLALLVVINTAKCLGIEVVCDFNHTQIVVW